MRKALSFITFTHSGVATFAGNASFKAPGLVNGPSNISRFNNPTDIAIDEDGNIFICKFSI